MFCQRKDTDQLRKIRRVSINDNFIVECGEGESIYQVLTDSGFAFLGNCGGRGICRRCFVEVKKSNNLTAQDGFKEERQENNRTTGTERVLACECRVESDLCVYTGKLWQYDEKNNREKNETAHTGHAAADFMAGEKPGIGAAVDAGSTTIAVSCLDMENGREISTFSFVNPQYAYGADVISRIRFCMEKEENLFFLGDILKRAVKEQLQAHLKTEYSRLAYIVYCGNTTMQHIIRGLPVDGLSKSPFTPVALDYENVMDDGIRTIYPPGFSAFVGADILTGAEYLSMGRRKDFDLLIDLGTNGELLLINEERGYASATACGPVFDSAVEGAAYGSESIKAIANCVRRRLIDSTGRIAAPFFDKGIAIDKDFVIRQENVRDFQLAKGAIYAGIQCLLTEAGITAEDIANVYISGGLGFYMDIRDAFTVKMLPKEFSDKIHISGNSSLKGAQKLLLAEGTQQKEILADYERLQKCTVSYQFAELDTFQDIYMQSLEF